MNPSADYCTISLLDNPTSGDVLQLLDEFKQSNEESADGSHLVTKIKLYGRCGIARLFDILKVLHENTADEIVWDDSLGHFDITRIYASGTQAQKELTDENIRSIPLPDYGESYDEDLKNLTLDRSLISLPAEKVIRLDIGKLVTAASSNTSLIDGYIRALTFGYTIQMTGNAPVPLVGWIMLTIMNQFSQVTYE